MQFKEERMTMGETEDSCVLLLFHSTTMVWNKLQSLYNKCDYALKAIRIIMPADCTD